MYIVIIKQIYIEELTGEGHTDCFTMSPVITPHRISSHSSSLLSSSDLAMLALLPSDLVFWLRAAASSLAVSRYHTKTTIGDRGSSFSRLRMTFSV
jgi:hypothetical protein